MKKILIFTLILTVSMSGIAQAIELVRQKNVATHICFPIIDADGDVVTGATTPDSEIDTFGDAAAPDGFVDCTNEAIEIGTSGIYYLSLAQAEMNADYIYIQVKTATAGAKTQHILIRTMVGDPLNYATSDDGGTINVTGGAIDTVTTATTATNLTTNNDKTGYTASTVSDKTGYSLTQSFPTNFSALSISATTGLVNITQTAADKVWGTTARTITDGTISTNSDKTGYALSTAGIDSIWDELLSGHTTIGSAGKALSDAGDPWSTDISTGYTGLAGAYVRSIYQNTDGVKDGGVWQPLESLIRMMR